MGIQSLVAANNGPLTTKLKEVNSLVEKTSFAAVFWPSAVLAPSNSDSNKWSILNVVVKNRSKKGALFAAVNPKPQQIKRSICCGQPQNRSKYSSLFAVVMG